MKEMKQIVNTGTGTDEGVFAFNKTVDMTKIVDSMQLDSDTVIASLTMDDGLKVSLETCGDVWIRFSPDGTEEKEDYYDKPSEFPDELKEIVAAGCLYADERVYAVNNNWFEVFIRNKEGILEASFLAEAERMTEENIREMLTDSIKNRPYIFQ